MFSVRRFDCVANLRARRKHPEHLQSRRAGFAAEKGVRGTLGHAHQVPAGVAAHDFVPYRLEPRTIE